MWASTLGRGAFLLTLLRSLGRGPWLDVDRSEEARAQAQRSVLVARSKVLVVVLAAAAAAVVVVSA